MGFQAASAGVKNETRKVFSMIFDYSNYTERRGSRGVVLYKSVETNTDLFAEEAKCPFCADSHLTTVYSKEKKDYPEWLWGSFDEYETVLRCDNCGWWQYNYRNQSDAVVDGIAASDLQIVSATLRTFDTGERSIPIQVLSQYIGEHPDKIYSIHDKAMERLVQSVFRDFFLCDVELVGKSHDGGKDLIMIDSGVKTFVQVKRRMAKDKVESVKEIRDLLGAAYSEDVRSCAFVSTADHYSSEAQKLANKMVEVRKFDRFDLIDCRQFIEMLKLTRKDYPEVWRKLLRISD